MRPAQCSDLFLLDLEVFAAVMDRADRTVTRKKGVGTSGLSIEPATVEEYAGRLRARAGTTQVGAWIKGLSEAAWRLGLQCRSGALGPELAMWHCGI
jgi:hypothetical protein